MSDPHFCWQELVSPILEGSHWPMQGPVQEFHQMRRLGDGRIDELSSKWTDGVLWCSSLPLQFELMPFSRHVESVLKISKALNWVSEAEPVMFQKLHPPLSQFFSKSILSKFLHFFYPFIHVFPTLHVFSRNMIHNKNFCQLVMFSPWNMRHMIQACHVYQLPTFLPTFSGW